MSTSAPRPTQLLRNFYNSIAYLPSLLAMAYIAVGIVALLPPLSDSQLPALITQLSLTSPDNARSLLAALLGGMISLMVFSFSMVMSVLSQAGGNFSQKLVFGLVSERDHQWVLGHYLGTILYVLMLLIVPNVNENQETWRSIAIYLACAMVIHCLALFIYFIHNVSRSIQVDTVVRDLHLATRHAMEQQRQKESGQQWRYLPAQAPITANRYAIYTDQAGYLPSVNLTALATLAEQLGGVIHLRFHFGEHVVENQPAMMLEASEAPDDSWCKNARDTLVYLDGESIDACFSLGMSQLMEVAIKALSPGINDPGTATLCLHRITDLLCRYLQWQPANTLVDSKGQRRVSWPVERFDSLLHRLFVPLLIYGKQDQSIQLELLKAVKTLSLFTKEENLDALQAMAERILIVLNHLSEHSMDRQFVNEQLNNGEHCLSLPALLPKHEKRLHDA
ncbi:DUF2254 domain-containing protein [Halomonas halocynthiae]|uniref:DUF2254 domain-containing protein n=1 Tax=Halomonas halocynthiae TaxID=176290 RepID=UPI000403100A|nr:DUF2254 domain-containing protein [Halomonas halocynthiae]